MPQLTFSTSSEVKRSKVKVAPGDCSSHHLNERGHIVAAALQAAQLVINAYSMSCAYFIRKLALRVRALVVRRERSLRGFAAGQRPRFFLQIRGTCLVVFRRQWRHDVGTAPHRTAPHSCARKSGANYAALDFTTAFPLVTLLSLLQLQLL